MINISIAGDRLRRTEYLAVAHARSKGAIVVAAAGNDGDDIGNISPGGLPGVITVAATGVDDMRTVFSNWGGGVDIAAPGVDILSIRARQTDLLKFERDDYVAGTAFVGAEKQYYRLTGTSFAAPFVSGVASLILSMQPELTDMQVTRMLMHSARDIGTPGWDQYSGYGLLDARAALEGSPDFYVLPRILNVVGVNTDQGFRLEVSGRAMADDFGRAWIEIGAGPDPDAWEKVTDDITDAVDSGTLALLDADHFRDGPEWTIRLVVEHANGSRREARFNLKVG